MSWSRPAFTSSFDIRAGSSGCGTFVGLFVGEKFGIDEEAVLEVVDAEVGSLSKSSGRVGRHRLAPLSDLAVRRSIAWASPVRDCRDLLPRHLYSVD